MTHEEYWKSRIDNVFDSNYHKNELKKMYIKAYAENEKQILKLYDELKKKGKLTTTQLYRIDRFMSLRKALAKQAEQVNSELNERMTQDLTNAYRETFGECVRELGLDMTWSMQNEKMLNKVLNTKWAGSNYSKRIWNNSQQLPKDVEAAVVDCLTRGTSKDVYVKAIKNKYNVGFSKADRLVRTELSHTINEGQRDIYKSYGFKKVKWYAAEDERMCKLCGSMHEKIYDIDDVPSVAHANCRCTFSPVAESLETGGKSTKTVDNSAKSDIMELPNIDKAVIPTEKFTKYALNPEKDVNKARAFKEALGYDLNNANELIKNITDNLSQFNAIEKPDNGYGKRYEVIMTLTGANKKKANVKTSWIVEADTGKIRLTSAYVTKKKFKE